MGSPLLKVLHTLRFGTQKKKIRGPSFLRRALDALQGGLELVVVVQPLFRQQLLFGRKADLFGAAARVADGQDPDQMAGALRAHGAAGAMADAAAKQGAAKDLGGGGEFGGKLGTGGEDRFLCFILLTETQKSTLVKGSAHQRRIKFHSLR